MGRYWLSYDLGLKGNYDELYTWLDGLRAMECGESVATFDTDMTFQQIREQLEPIVGTKARIYLVGKDLDGKWHGRWLLGKRRRAAWAGYAEVASQEEDPAE